MNWLLKCYIILNMYVDLFLLKVTYQRLIARFCEEGDIQGAT